VEWTPDGPRKDPRFEAIIFGRGGFFRRKTFIQLPSLHLTFHIFHELSKPQQVTNRRAGFNERLALRDIHNFSRPLNPNFNYAFIFEDFVQRKQLKESFPMRYNRTGLEAWFSLPPHLYFSAQETAHPR
jgi:hypothetical protein